MRRRNSSSPAISLFSFQDIITSVIGIMVLLLMVLAIELVSRKQGATTAAETTAPDRTVVDQLQEQIQEMETQIRALQAATVVEDFESLAKLSPSNVSDQRRELVESIEKYRSQQVANKVATERAERSMKETEANSRKDSHANSQIGSLQAELKELEEARARLVTGNRLIFNPAPGDKTPWLIELSESVFAAARATSTSTPQLFDNRRTGARIDALCSWAKTRNRSTEYFVLLLKPSAIEHLRPIQTQLRAAGFDLGLELIAEDQTVLDVGRGAGG